MQKLNPYNFVRENNTTPRGGDIIHSSNKWGKQVRENNHFFFKKIYWTEVPCITENSSINSSVNANHFYHMLADIMLYKPP